MPQDKTSTQELVWLYSRTQASLLVDCEAADAIIRNRRYHTSSSHCPCLPWETCDCECHAGDDRKRPVVVKSPVT